VNAAARAAKSACATAHLKALKYVHDLNSASSTEETQP
jgi:hypothetical protein